MLGNRALSDTSKFRLPEDLLAELQRRGSSLKNDFRVDGWKPSLIGRFMELFAGKRRR